MKPIIVFLFSLIQITYAQNAIRNRKVQEAPANNNKPTSNPFLSTTLSSKITFSESASSHDHSLDSTRKSLFSETLSDFLTKIFHDQQVYHLKIISVHIFDDHILKDGHYEETTQQNNAQHTLSFSTVVSAEYTQENEINSVANESYRKMVEHVCDKFQGHLMKFMKDTGDPYFMDVESIVLGDFERMHSAEELSGLGEMDGNNNNVMGMSKETLNVASIAVIVVGSIVFFGFALASVQYYRKEKQLKADRWTSKEIASINAGTFCSTNSAGALGNTSHPAIALDDYSFDPLGATKEYNGGNSNVYNGVVPPFTDYRDDPIHTNPSINEETTDFSSVWPESAPPTMFPTSGAAATPAPPKLTYTEELQKLPKQHVFAPPGKIGVAIDVLNGQPTVHKVRKGSPLENMLQANDIITSIDDEDTSCLSAADVTKMMVKRMDRVRKITFVRRGK